jgi:hypothetical protein
MLAGAVAVGAAIAALRCLHLKKCGIGRPLVIHQHKRGHAELATVESPDQVPRADLAGIRSFANFRAVSSEEPVPVVVTQAIPSMGLARHQPTLTVASLPDKLRLRHVRRGVANHRQDKVNPAASCARRSAMTIVDAPAWCRSEITQVLRVPHRRAFRSSTEGTSRTDAESVTRPSCSSKGDSTCSPPENVRNSLRAPERCPRDRRRAALARPPH